MYMKVHLNISAYPRAYPSTNPSSHSVSIYTKGRGPKTKAKKGGRLFFVETKKNDKNFKTSEFRKTIKFMIQVK